MVLASALISHISVGAALHVVFRVLQKMGHGV